MNAPLPLAPFPVGFRRFHRRAFINYQLNRAHALGYADAGELRGAAQSVRSFADCARVFDALSGAAESAGRLRHATTYLRLAEFFTPQRSDAKVAVYLRYRELFDAAFGDVGAVRHDVAYQGAAMPAYHLAAPGGHGRGVVLFHGGFDSLIEEFLPIWARIAAAGFDVVAFEGPGQGGARALSGLTFDHDWERPVGAILDHFGVDRAALVGLSMGGYWAIRAASREPRIDRVVAWPPVYDWLHRLRAPMREPVRIMLRQRRAMNLGIRLRARSIPVVRHVVEQALYLVDGDEPMDAVEWLLSMNARHLGSERVWQDVLLMCGAHDAFQPPALGRQQAAALTSARSVTLRVFTAAEHADRHCQTGNLGLACGVVTTWLRGGPASEEPHSSGGT